MTYLIDLGMDINAIWRRDYPPSWRIGRGTPFHAAVGAREVDRIEFLFTRGADVEVKNTLGLTPLEFAVANGFTTSETALRNMLIETALKTQARLIPRVEGARISPFPGRNGICHK